MTDSAYLLAGLPGAGKTEAAKFIAELEHGTYYESGDVVRNAAKELDYVDHNDSEDLGQYAAQRRRDDGPAFVAEILVGDILRGDRAPTYPVAISGVRHAEEVKEYRQFFDTVIVVWIEAGPETRLGRLTNRGRDGEDGFDLLALMQRDEREMKELGVATLHDEDMIDVTIENESVMDVFFKRIRNEVVV